MPKAAHKVVVIGHRNPDTDSIVSAMAYAALRNALGDREFVPARLGHISDETRLVLGRFGFEPPIRIQTMRTQVRDLDYDTPPADIHAVYPERLNLSAKVACFVEHLRDYLRQHADGPSPGKSNW